MTDASPPSRRRLLAGLFRAEEPVPDTMAVVIVPAEMAMAATEIIAAFTRFSGISVRLEIAEGGGPPRVAGNGPDAKAFLAFLASPAARAVLATHGMGVAGGDDGPQG